MANRTGSNVNDRSLYIPLLCTPLYHSAQREQPWCLVGPFGSDDRSFCRCYDHCHIQLQIINIDIILYYTDILCRFKILTIIIFICVKAVPDCILCPTPQCSSVNCAWINIQYHTVYHSCPYYLCAHVKQPWSIVATSIANQFTNNY